MAVIAHKQYRIKGTGGGMKGYVAIATLVAGSVDVSHGFRTVTNVQVTPIDASAIPAESFGAIATVPTTGFLRQSTGITVVKSSNGSSTESVFINIMGY